MRAPICSELISMEKIAIFLPAAAAFIAIVVARAVLPTLGRAAMMIRSDFCQPPVTRSMLAMPVGTPALLSPAAMRAMRSYARPTISGAVQNLPLRWLLLAEKRIDSALSRACSVESGELYPSSAILRAASISLR